LIDELRLLREEGPDSSPTRRQDSQSQHNVTPATSEATLHIVDDDDQLERPQLDPQYAISVPGSTSDTPSDVKRLPERTPSRNSSTDNHSTTDGSEQNSTHVSQDEDICRGPEPFDWPTSPLLIPGSFNPTNHNDFESSEMGSVEVPLLDLSADPPTFEIGKGVNSSFRMPIDDRGSAASRTDSTGQDGESEVDVEWTTLSAPSPSSSVHHPSDDGSYSETPNNISSGSRTLVDDAIFKRFSKDSRYRSPPARASTQDSISCCDDREYLPSGSSTPIPPVHCHDLHAFPIGEHTASIPPITKNSLTNHDLPTDATDEIRRLDRHDDLAVQENLEFFDESSLGSTPRGKSTRLPQRNMHTIMNHPDSQHSHSVDRPNRLSVESTSSSQPNIHKPLPSVGPHSDDGSNSQSTSNPQNPRSRLKVPLRGRADRPRIDSFRLSTFSPFITLPEFKDLVLPSHNKPKCIVEATSPADPTRITRPRPPRPQNRPNRPVERTLFPASPGPHGCGYEPYVVHQVHPDRRRRTTFHTTSTPRPQFGFSERGRLGDLVEEDLPIVGNELPAENLEVLPETPAPATPKRGWRVSFTNFVKSHLPSSRRNTLSPSTKKISGPTCLPIQNSYSTASCT
jgi:hypothetical protein